MEIIPAVFVTHTLVVSSVTGIFVATATQRTKDAPIAASGIVRIVKMMNSFIAITANHMFVEIVARLTFATVEFASKYVARSAHRETQWEESSAQNVTDIFALIVLRADITVME